MHSTPKGFALSLSEPTGSIPIGSTPTHWVYSHPLGLLPLDPLPFLSLSLTGSIPIGSTPAGSTPTPTRIHFHSRMETGPLIRIHSQGFKPSGPWLVGSL